MTIPISKFASSFTTDKFTAHKYGTIYDDIFMPLKDLPIKILEIGVAGGESIRLWHSYFPKAEITGIDVVPGVRKMSNRSRVQYFFGRQDSPSFLKMIGETIGPQDIIIDDGSHFGLHQRISFQTLWPFVKPEGWYFVEDLQAEDWPSFRNQSEYFSQTMVVPLVKSLLKTQHEVRKIVVVHEMIGFQKVAQ